MSRRVVAVLGASGFVGSASVLALCRRGADVTVMSAPRIQGTSVRSYVVTELSERFQGLDAVVNAAGVPDASSTDSALLHHANAALPDLVAQACQRAGVRMVHVSSAAVQGRRPSLDDSVNTYPFSVYSSSKAEGEVRVRTHGETAVIFRPPGVHDASRRVTQQIGLVARSPLSSVAAPGTANTAQALVGNVADAIAFLAMHPGALPQIVHYPSEGLTTARILSLLGGHDPKFIPPRLASAAVGGAFAMGRWRPLLLAQARRLEMLWFGQDQEPSWLTSAGWRPPQGHHEWKLLGDQLKSDRQEARILKEEER